MSPLRIGRCGLTAILVCSILSGCTPATRQNEDPLVTLLRNPRTRPIGVLELDARLAGMPPEQRRNLIAFMLKEPSLRDIGMRAYYIDAGMVAPGYPGNCPTDYHYDIAGNRCGARSAISRPGGY